jgi:predicted DNA-binding transcriptional regulator AlpA
MTRFYRIKEICLSLGISVTSLRSKIEKGELPNLEHPHPINTRVAGYSEETYQKIIRDLMQRN